jgi:hypothetical protein
MQNGDSKIDSDFKVDKIEVPDPEYVSEIPDHMKNNIIPGFPSTTLICGPPGKGKTTLLICLLLKKTMWNGFFDCIYAYGPTVKSDKLYKRIKLKKENIIDEVDEIIPDLDKKLKEQTKKVAANPNTAPKILFLFEDMTSFFNTVQHKPQFHRCYTQCRHVKGASVTMVHKYKAFHRTPRISSQHLIFFECNMKDVAHLYEEFGPTTFMNVKQFTLMFQYATCATKDDPKPFFYINTCVPMEERYRRNFTQIMQLNPSGLLQPSLTDKTKREKRRGGQTEMKRRGRSLSPNDGLGETGRDRA